MNEPLYFHVLDGHDLGPYVLGEAPEPLQGTNEDGADVLYFTSPKAAGDHRHDAADCSAAADDTETYTPSLPPQDRGKLLLAPLAGFPLACVGLSMLLHPADCTVGELLFAAGVGLVAGITASGALVLALGSGDTGRAWAQMLRREDEGEGRPL